VSRAGACDVISDMTVPSRTVEPADWVSTLRAGGAGRDRAVAELHALLLRAARFEARRRGATLPWVGAAELDDLVLQAADDALVAVLARLDSFRGESRFTTWAYKFAIYSTAVALRRRAWRDREVSLAPEVWELVPDRGAPPPQQAEDGELRDALRCAIAALTPHQRDVLVAVALEQVPIDVLAERLGTTRGALYKTLHDGRRKLRAQLADSGWLSGVDAPVEETR
jgi:RNA polymerase sigma-70 factor, ECF subfamily